VWLLLAAVPLRLTFWVLAVAGVWVVFMFVLVVVRHLQSRRAAGRRERVQRELGPVFSRFLESDDHARLARELRPAFMRMDAAERPVAAVLVTELMEAASFSGRERLRDAFVDAGIVELGARGTRRRSPWRRALACEMLGKIGARESVPVLLARLNDRRPEVRIAAVRALGEVGSDEAVPALSAMFLERAGAPTNVVSDALRRIGTEAVGPAFAKGVLSPDSVVRVSACFGLAATAATHGGSVHRLAEVLASDPVAQVRVAAAAALGIAGRGNAPAELVAAAGDQDVRVRRSAVKALGSFDDPSASGALDERTEDDDREVALRAAEALVVLAERPRAGTEARARLESSSAWAVAYARTVAEVSSVAAVSS
jgi:HEAT repeat protein